MNQEMKTYKKSSICPYDCPTSCGLCAITDGTKILSIEGDPSHPVSQGLICGKMRHYAEEINSKERILTPLKRTGEKGSGSFTPISWEEAIETITSRWKTLLQTDGPSSIAYCYYAGVMGIIQRHCVQAFFNRMGACDLKKTLCSTAKSTGYASVMGTTGCLDPRELKESDYYLIWGSNVKATRLHTLKDLKEGKNKGKKLIQIEVYGAPMAPYVDETILIRPGTDGALALAMMHVLVKEGLADEAYLTEHAIGYHEFKETLSSYTPAWASTVTGIPEETIYNLALEYGHAKAPAILLGSGNSRYGNGSMTVRLITILSQFTGAWNSPGGGLCGCTPSGGSYYDGELVKRTAFRKEPPERTININQFGAALAASCESFSDKSFCESPDKNSSESPDFPTIKSLYVAGGNPANSVSNQTALLEGLKREDLFTVVHDRFLSDTARYADIILPATFSLEHPDCYEAYGYCTMASARKIVNPPGEAKSNWDTIALLAKSMGYDDDYFHTSEDDMFKKLIQAPTPKSEHLTSEQRQTLLNGGVLSMPLSNHMDVQTPEKKFYIVNPHIEQPMPHYTECYGGKEPLKLVSVPSNETLNSIHQNHPALAQKRGPMTLIMNAEDASTRGIKTGDKVLCYNELAEVEFFAEVTDLIAKGSVACVGVYKASQSLNGLTCNALHHDRLTDDGEATTMNDNTVEVRKL